MQGRRFILAACVVVLVSQAVSQAQHPTYRSVTELVSLNVTVVGADRRHVSGLTSENFEVREDGVPQSLQYFASGETPLDVLLLLDTSSSMTESLKLMQEAARRFVGVLRPGDRVGVMGVSDGLRIIQPLTTDLPAVTSAIVSTHARGQTRLYTSLYTALRELTKLRGLDVEPRRQAMIVLTDGQDTASGLSFADLLGEARRRGVPIYTIAPRAPRELRRIRELAFGQTTEAQDFELRTLASDTGAQAFFPVTLKDLSGIYERIADELAHQYSLGYQSSNTTTDGGFRRIALRVTAPGVTWRTRTGYIAPDDVGPNANSDDR